MRFLEAVYSQFTCMLGYFWGFLKTRRRQSCQWWPPPLDWFVGEVHVQDLAFEAFELMNQVRIRVHDLEPF